MTAPSDTAEEDDERPAWGGQSMAALRQQTFRRVYTGAFFSNIGTWMQNVVLGALAYDLTKSSSFVGLVLFAQLGPMLFFSIIGGMLADSFDRRKLLIIVSATQAVLAFVLAGVVSVDDPNKWAIVGVVFLIGLGQSVFGPTYSALLPDLVGPGNLAGAISLNSTQMNGSRVIGPAVGGFLFSQWGAHVVFALNGLTFAFVIGALASVRFPPPEPLDDGESRFERIALGFRIARHRFPVGRSLVIMVLFSFLSLPFIGQMPVLADRNLDIDATTTAYGWLYACFGLGAMLGALSVGTTFSNTPKEDVTRWSLVAFGLALGVFAWLRQPAPAYVVIVIVGFFYFASVTALSTVLQMHLAGNERGRVMALWGMAFGGTVPMGNLVAGPIIEATSVTTVVFPGAVIALALAWWADLHVREPAVT
ncbi:MAG TPA: MFS transporter [Acidimicrobiales bacterium]|nr:MFS transporter [Acidimicrobiales bacterium]